MKNRIIDRARQEARLNPVDPPLCANDVLAAVALALFLSALLWGGAAIRGLL